MGRCRSHWLLWESQGKRWCSAAFPSNPPLFFLNRPDFFQMCHSLLFQVLYKSNVQYTLFHEINQPMFLGTLSMLLRESKGESFQRREFVAKLAGSFLVPQLKFSDTYWVFMIFYVTQSSGMLSEPESPAGLLYLTAGGQMCRERLASHSWIWHPSD